MSVAAGQRQTCTFSSDILDPASCLFEITFTESSVELAKAGVWFYQEVKYFRAFRDEYLLTSEEGRRLVNLYYTLSPPVADAIRSRQEVRAAVRTALKPLAELSRMLVSRSGIENH